MKISFSPPNLSDEDIAEVVAVLKSGWLTTGPKTKEFERQIASFCKTDKAACFSSQTAAAEITLRLLGIGKGDEVILPAYTYTATASVVCHVGATPVMIDCAPGSFFMDYGKLEAAINHKTKVIMPVDLAGIICDYDKIFDIVTSKKHFFKPAENKYQEAFNRIIVVADSAHAFGAKRLNKTCGQFADFTNFSFHAVKNLTTGEGGASTWKNIPGISNDEIYQEFMLYSLHGQSKDAMAKLTGNWEYDVVAPLYKCNMTDIHAALGVSQLKRYDKILSRRRNIIEKYDKAFEQMPFQSLKHFDDENISTGHLYLMRFLEQSSDFRDKFIINMAETGISCNVHYKPLPMLTAYKNLGFCIEDFPNAYKMFENEVSLPLHTCLTDIEAEHVIANTIKIYNELK